MRDSARSSVSVFEAALTFESTGDAQSSPIVVSCCTASSQPSVCSPPTSHWCLPSPGISGSCTCRDKSGPLGWVAVWVTLEDWRKEADSQRTKRRLTGALFNVHERVSGFRSPTSFLSSATLQVTGHRNPTLSSVSSAKGSPLGVRSQAGQEAHAHNAHDDGLRAMAALQVGRHVRVSVSCELRGKQESMIDSSAEL